LTFENLGLRTELLRAVREQGYADPTPIQARTIPTILQGRDVMATAQTGTGKTAGFTLPLLQRLMETRRAGRPRVRALVLAPTRELALQVTDSVATYGRHLPLRVTAVHGGVGLQPQARALRAVDIVVATPGRLLDHAGSGAADLSVVEILVLDEADRMLDMGFLPDIRRILALLPARRQNLMFSATFDAPIRALAGGFLDRPQLVEVARRDRVADGVRETAYRVDRERKVDLLAALFRAGNWSQALVFTRTKHGANRLAEKLDRSGISADAIHGNKSQSARSRALSLFRSGRVRALVATEVAARGLDIDGLPHVVNFELPLVAEDYVHRIGRTARAGARGEAHSLVCIDEHGLLRDIERLLQRSIPVRDYPGFEPDPRIASEPISRGGGGGGGRGRRGAGGARPAPARRRRSR
jgi:ATP-dependent RNA helicase RhlE